MLKLDGFERASKQMKHAKRLIGKHANSSLWVGLPAASASAEISHTAPMVWLAKYPESRPWQLELGRNFRIHIVMMLGHRLRESLIEPPLTRQIQVHASLLVLQGPKEDPSYYKQSVIGPLF